MLSSAKENSISSVGKTHHH